MIAGPSRLAQKNVLALYYFLQSESVLCQTQNPEDDILCQVHKVGLLNPISGNICISTNTSNIHSHPPLWWFITFMAEMRKGSHSIRIGQVFSSA